MITAVTAQNTLGVTRWSAVEPALVRAQLDAVATDLRPAALKSGMLANTGVVAAVAAGLREHGLRPYVLDPVMVATSGDLLLEPDAVLAIRRDLVPLCDLITPNLDEAGRLLGTSVRDVDGMIAAATMLVRELGAGASLVTGGHLAGAEVFDVFYDGEIRVFRSPRIETTSTHGTGCTLSAAAAAQLALGETLGSAVARALDFVHRAIASAPGLGAGHGPLNHFAR